MKLNVVILITFLLVWPKYSLGHDESKINISRLQYLRYIRPQMKSIVSDFKTLLKQSFPYLSPWINLNSKLLSVENNFYKQQRYCMDSTSARCLKIIEDLHHEIAELDRVLIEKEINIVHPLLKQCEFPEKLSCIDQYHFFRQLMINNFELLMAIKQFKTVFQTTFSDQTRLMNIKTLIDFNRRYWEHLVLTPIPSDRESIYREFTVDFIKPLHNIINTNNGEKLFVKQLKRLNITFNHFAKQLSKGSHKLSPSTLKILNTIHFRWNSILKLLLR
ncbi:MAG: hypothetical protein ACOCUH_04675 [Bacteriovoracia bacterium]